MEPTMMSPWAKCSACLRLICTAFRIRGIVRRIVAVLVLLVSASLLSAHTVITTKITWSREVSRIAYQHCASCHHDGGSSFSLMTYEEARPWAEAIKQQVIAPRPDGSVEPLIWLEQFNPRYTGTYYFQNVLRFPAGTKIQIMPPKGEVALLIGSAK